MDEFKKAQTSAFQQLAKQPSLLNIKLMDEFSKAQTSSFKNFTTNLTLKSQPMPAKLITPFLEITASSIRKQLDKSVGFYEERDLQPLKVQSKMQTTKAKTLAAKLKACSPGRENWELYQDICKDILSFCLVPPLSPAFEQVETKDRIHIRDLIFSIPHELGSFWTYVTNRFGLALIFECKNYVSLLRENNLIISQKYVGKRKLTRLGIIITRRGAA